MVGKIVEIYRDNGDFFSKGIIVKFENNQIYIKYLGEYERKEFGYFNFDIVVDYLEAKKNKRIVVCDE